ncbi:MAG TPA: rhodanese-like domain-containing protein [Candidatus Angelobacter sp.]|nr:rhodanese-like domain-containing protein [Candidatus Angelobacter sp.]
MMGFLRNLGSVRRGPAAVTMVAAAVFTAAIMIRAYAAAPAGDIPSGNVIQPQELAQALKSAQKPVVLYTGPEEFYAQAHIPGAENIGPAGKPEGMKKLRARAASLSKDMPVVIYCGCCPWDHCPNIRPAFAELKKLGFSKVRVLYLATSLGVDWKDKGFPVASGE